MNYIKSKLSRQLLCLIVVIFGLVFISLGIILPQLLLPVYEENLYNYLKEPLSLVGEDINDNQNPNIDTEIAYVYIYQDNVVTSENLTSILPVSSVGEVIPKMTNEYGSFVYKLQKYYYYQENSNDITKIALTNDRYINKTKADVLYSVLPITLITFIIISFMLIIWSHIIVRRIEKLKEKIDHIDDDSFNHHVDENQTDDEIKTLDYAIEDMRNSLKHQEELRNQMYQNISHDFKTPLTVIKSYIEAVSDGVESAPQALDVIQEQTNKLEQKVHSLLYLNKLDYLKSYNNVKMVPVDINRLVKESTEKFKFSRKDVKFSLSLDEKASFIGTDDLWETIIDNMLGNFIRYAKTEIKITTKKKEIIFYNDGPNIEEDLKEGIFIPFRKGMKGEFGLGLSIIKKTVDLMGYTIEIRNLKKGVSFIIKGTK